MKCIINILIICTISIGCDKLIQSPEKKGDFNTSIRPLGNLGFGADSLSCVKGCYEKLPERKDTTFIINDYTDYYAFKKYVSCLEINSWPSVDFEKNTMLAGTCRLGVSCGRLIPEKFSLTNNNGNYKFNVVIKIGGYFYMSVVCYWVLINKISPDSDVEFIIEYVTSK